MSAGMSTIIETLLQQLMQPSIQQQQRMYDDQPTERRASMPVLPFTDDIELRNLADPDMVGWHTDTAGNRIMHDVEPAQETEYDPDADSWHRNVPRGRANPITMPGNLDQMIIDTLVNRNTKMVGV